jgi:hypothetical protein
MATVSRRTLARAAAFVLGPLLCLPPLARAVDIPIIGRKLVVVDKVAAAGKAKAVFVSKDALVTKGAGTDPAQIEETLEIAYDAQYGAFLMPPGGNWLSNSATVGKYVNKGAPSGGAVKVGVIKPTKLVKVVGKSLGDAPLRIASLPRAAVHVVDTIVNGGEVTRLCTKFNPCVHRVIAGGTGYKLVCRESLPDTTCQAGRAPLPACGDAASPECNGVCPAGYSCLSFLSDFCDCAPQVDPFVGQCGELAGPPTCLGECPPWAPICADADGTCTCVASLAPIDNGDGTVTDPDTGLMWETKDGDDGIADPSNLHDVDNRYSWAGMCTLNTVLCQPNAAAAATCAAQTGGTVGCGECGVGEGTCDVDAFATGAITTIWDWVNGVNATGYAGHSDWRLATSAGCCGFPTGEPAELESIVDLGAPGCGGGSPCIDAIFGPTVANFYFSASTVSSSFSGAWGVNFISGGVFNLGKIAGHWVRAVRYGS